MLRARPVAEATGYVYEGRLRGLDEPAKAGFAAKSRGLQPPGFNNLGRLAIAGWKPTRQMTHPVKLIRTLSKI